MWSPVLSSHAKRPSIAQSGRVFEILRNLIIKLDFRQYFWHFVLLQATARLRFFQYKQLLSGQVV